ncbi:phage tail tube protein [Tissierella praeacuta]|uniref:phage tail tube protein n=1 Tax=Tissierella praeacuta TaxID=43131 RepID=UPI002FD907CB
MEENKAIEAKSIATMSETPRVDDVQRALGTKLLIGEESPLAVARLRSIGGLDLSADTIDITTLESDGGYREFIAGFKDAGEVPLEGYFVPTEGKGQKELYDRFESGEEDDYVIQFPRGVAKWEFKGIVVGFSTSADLEDPLAFSASIKVSGKPKLTVGTGGAG